jgi:predicted dehydrogenase
MTKRKVKVGIVGCGVVATAYYLPYLMRNADLVAVCDTNPIRTEACRRLFGAKETYTDYFDMIRRADIEAVFILTGPGTHARFTLAAVDAGKHVLLQKPMATNMVDANAIVDAVRNAGVKALIEPSSNTPLDPQYAHLRSMINAGVIGKPLWFTLVNSAPDSPTHPGLGGNPYGLQAFYSADSGGYLFDFPYAPSEIVTLLGECRRVHAAGQIAMPDRMIVPESEYDAFLQRATDPEDSNYWDVVLKLPRTEPVTMGAEDNVISTYEMTSGVIGVFQAVRHFHPVPKGRAHGGLEIYGSEGTVVMGGSYFASVYSSNIDALPSMDETGWHRIPLAGDLRKAKWPKPIPGGFNYYERSSQHLIDCILEDREPVVNVEWGRHITEMLCGAIESSRTGRRYEMTTRLGQGDEAMGR